ncbi:MAG: hypothetical protein ACE5FH_09745, partial [Candidatus Zixiibacteriota bacterium]
IRLEDGNVSGRWQVVLDHREIYLHEALNDSCPMMILAAGHPSEVPRLLCRFLARCHAEPSGKRAISMLSDVTAQPV